MASQRTVFNIASGHLGVLPHLLLLPTFLSVIATRYTWLVAIAGRTLIATLIFSVGFFAAPSLYARALGATVVFLLLVLTSRKGAEKESEASGLPPILPHRVLVFAGLNAAVVAIAHFGSALPAFAEGSSMAAAWIAPLAALSVFLTTLALFPRNMWGSTWKRFRPELIAAFIVLFTFLPHHLSRVLWSQYSGVLGYLVYHGAHFLLPGIAYVAGPNPIVTGPAVDVQMSAGSSGIEGICLFEYLFGAVVVLEWARVNKVRALIAYAGGLGAMVTANILRIIFLILAGNLIASPAAIGRFRVHAGWIFYSVMFLLFLFITYRWLHAQPSGTAESTRARLRTQPSRS
jgi:exosortase/archaeosortase family protein